MPLPCRVSATGRDQEFQLKLDPGLIVPCLLNTVILSEVGTSQSEVPAESNDPAFDCITSGASRKFSRQGCIARMPCGVSDKISSAGILRLLRICFAERSRCSAQDDRVNRNSMRLPQPVSRCLRQGGTTKNQFPPFAKIGRRVGGNLPEPDLSRHPLTKRYNAGSRFLTLSADR